MNLGPPILRAGLDWFRWVLGWWESIREMLLKPIPIPTFNEYENVPLVTCPIFLSFWKLARNSMVIYQCIHRIVPYLVSTDNLSHWNSGRRFVRHWGTDTVGNPHGQFWSLTGIIWVCIQHMLRLVLLSVLSVYIWIKSMRFPALEALNRAL